MNLEDSQSKQSNSWYYIHVSKRDAELTKVSEAKEQLSFSLSVSYHKYFPLTFLSCRLLSVVLLGGAWSKRKGGLSLWVFPTFFFFYFFSLLSVVSNWNNQMKQSNETIE